MAGRSFDLSYVVKGLYIYNDLENAEVDNKGEGNPLTDDQHVENEGEGNPLADDQHVENEGEGNPLADDQHVENEGDGNELAAVRHVENEGEGNPLAANPHVENESDDALNPLAANIAELQLTNDGNVEDGNVGDGLHTHDVLQATVISYVAEHYNRAPYLPFTVSGIYAEMEDMGYAISRGTVNNAIKELLDHGMVTRRRIAGQREYQYFYNSAN